MSRSQVNIVGAGISGLHAAFLLEQKGYTPTIWESSDRVGGRMKTDIVSGYQMDRGFQVLLDQYPFLMENLNFKNLELQDLLPGALLVGEQKNSLWGDPLRKPSIFWQSAFSSVASISDKWKVFQLRKELQLKDLEDHFNNTKTTLEFLKDYGFSKSIIENFFRPFFAGIYLETELKTSSAMFCFVFSLFSNGNAVIPAAGIEAIPKQLLTKLKQTTIHYNTKVDKVVSGKLIIKGVDQIHSDHTIICTDPSPLIDQLDNSSIEWNSLDTFYFEVDKAITNQSILLLFPSTTVINHAFYPQSIKTASRGEKELLSVNIVDRPGMNDDELLLRVKKEVENLLSHKLARLIKHYSIKKALPRFNKMQYSSAFEESILMDGIYLAGDQQLNPSQNASIASSEAAVEAVVSKFN